MRPGTLSAGALAVSGVAMALRPKQAAGVLGLAVTSQRGVAETRVGLGGTFAGLGLWALARGTSDAYSAAGATWLGAAAVRVISLNVDEPDPDWTFWAYLAGEIGLGVLGFAAGNRR